MSKYCGYCGNPIEGNINACGNCGASLKETAKEHFKKEKTKNIAQLVAFTLSVALVLFIALNVILGFVGAKGVARKVMNAYIDSDVDTLLDVASDYYYIQSDLNGTSIGTYYEDQIDSVMERYESYVGENFKITYKITDSEEFNDYRITKFLDKMSDLDDYDIDNVSKIVSVDLDMKIKGKSRSTTDHWQLIIIKESGHWRLFSMGIDNSAE